MRKYGVYVALTGATVCLVACGIKFGGSFSNGGIAVVDLDKVAEATGKTVEMRDALARQEYAFKQELLGFQNQANTELTARAQKLKEEGEAATEESKREFLVLRQKASNVLAQGQNNAGTKLNQMHQVQIARFRADLKPIIQDEATKRGLSVVIPKNEGLLLAVQPGADITDAVIKAYQAKRPAAAPAAAPAPAASASAAPAQTAAKPAAAQRSAARESKDSDSDSKH